MTPYGFILMVIYEILTFTCLIKHFAVHLLLWCTFLLIVLTTWHICVIEQSSWYKIVITLFSNCWVYACSDVFIILTKEKRESSNIMILPTWFDFHTICTALTSAFPSVGPLLLVSLGSLWWGCSFIHGSLH